MINIQSLNTFTLRKRQKVSVRRMLFGPVNHEETKKGLQKEMAKICDADRQRWNFDFARETPLPGSFAWERVPLQCADVHPSYGMDRLPFIGGKLQYDYDCDVALLSPDARPRTPERDAEDSENHRVFRFGSDVVGDSTRLRSPSPTAATTEESRTLTEADDSRRATRQQQTVPQRQQQTVPQRQRTLTDFYRSVKRPYNESSLMAGSKRARRS
ncbi:PREDICTED: cyclin-dependent kinase inhibitor 1-like [Priapulus caudatus]|uniref:Cyclin-dependent kinase inhibitor 1-like n=1 Tax=Priapulus caudatus TaxID=37621 RepID=A0ABM1DVE4_PRICU|nr:PREDICTED: cyclin-dependent kinase inhibitor 1-like [Priapulus caudatus]